MKVSLYTSALASMAHEAIFLPWLQRAAALAPASPLGVAVVVPQRSDAYYLKALALKAGLGLWGVHFLAPAQLRDYLAAHLRRKERIPLREHSRLLFATAAEGIAAPGDAGLEQVAAVAPDQLLRVIDMIGAAGWEFGQVGPPRLRPIVAEFNRLLSLAGWEMVHTTDRAMLQATQAGQKPAPCFSELFIAGFNGLHWAHWPLLEAAVRLAKNSVICLTEPRAGSEELDAAWIGTWENTFSIAGPVDANSTPPLAEALAVPETSAARTQRREEPVREIEFLVAKDSASHARAIVAKAVQFLADPACERLGILFPATGSLSRQVAALLADLHVAHYDGLAHHAPGPLEDAAWPAWLALQENPRSPALLHFLAAMPDAPFGNFTAEAAATALERIVPELLIDDLGVIAEYLRGHPAERFGLLSEAMRALPLLPERAPLREYFARCAEIFRGYGWLERAEALEGYAPDWERSRDLPVSRRNWLRWLRETLVSWQSRRAEPGSHPYSRLHLLSYIHAEMQSWTHLIATGLNEGQWPPTIEESGFLDEEEITALNSQVRTLNRRVEIEGRQGEGHVAVQAGKTLCIGPTQRRALVERQFYNTLESATTAIVATLQVQDDDAPERPLNPSEFFAGLHFAARGRAVSQQTLDSLREETDRWLRAATLWKPPAAEDAVAQPTRAAFDARRDADRPFGGYEFALRAAPSHPLQLSTTQWEDAISSPAQVFLDAIVGVTPGRGDEETPWAQARGNWVHRWLSAIVPRPGTLGPAPLPSPTEMRKRVRDAAEAFRNSVAAALAIRRRTLPDWWQSAWQQAWSAAAALVDSVAAVEGRTYAATEWRIENTPLSVAGGMLSVRGRADLILSSGATFEDVWIVDYKTGQSDPLKLTEIAAGKRIQLALYALALRAAGAKEAGVSLLGPNGTLAQPQVDLASIAGLDDLWRGLLRIQESGVFGMHGPLRAEFGYGQDYPLATLAIEEEILAQKWRLSHPEFAAPEEEG